MRPDRMKQMMAHLTRPGMARGGRIGFEKAGPVKSKFYAPKAAETKKLKATKKLKDFVEKFKLNNKGQLPTQQQIMKAVGGKSETIQKYLTEGVDYAKRITKQEAGRLAGLKSGEVRAVPEGQDPSYVKRAKTLDEASKFLSKQDAADFKKINAGKKAINKYFKSKPELINTTEFGKNIKQLLSLRMDKDTGAIFSKLRSDQYYEDLASKGKLFDIFDIKAVKEGGKSLRFPTNINITPGQFNQVFIQNQVGKFFAKGLNEEAVKNVENLLKERNIRVKLPNVGYLGQDNPVAVDRTKGTFPKIQDTLKSMKAPKEILDLFETENLLLKLAGQIDKDCAQAVADGGRIGLQAIGSTSVCITKAKNYMSEQLEKGIGTQQNAKTSLIKRIISGTGQFIKQGLNPSELFKLENLVGKPALYATAAIESGLLADDVLRKKEPINVAAAENFLFGNLLNLDADAERAKNIINDPNLSPAAKTYAQGIIDQDNFTKLSQTYATNLVKNPLFIPSGAKAKADTALANLKNKITNIPETGRMDYESLLADKQDAFTAKEKRFDAPDKPGLPSFTSGQLEKRNVPGEFVIDPSFPLPLQRETLVPSYVSPSYSPERSKFETDEFINKYLKSIGEEPLRSGEGTLFRMNTPQLGLFGTQERFARGGLSGGDTSGPPPERGPNPQGLLSLKNRVRNL